MGNDEVDLWSSLEANISDLETDDFDEKMMNSLKKVPRRFGFSHGLLIAVAIHIVFFGAIAFYVSNKVSEPKVLAFINVPLLE